MKKIIALLFVAGMLVFSANSVVKAAENDEVDKSKSTEQVADQKDVKGQVVETPAAADEVAEVPMHQQLKIKFIEGGPMWMAPILLALIFGLAISFERILYLNFASQNTKKLLTKVEEALKNGGVEEAKEVCRNTRGPVASIFYQGLDRYDHGIDVVEKSIVSYGSVQMGLLEKGLTWIALFIALAPMLGFLGTVVGMVAAFDAIEAAGDINPSLVAGGMKIALITTIGGLIVAMILQVFYNYIIGKIDSIVNDMEDSSISMIDILVEHQNKKA